MSGRPAKPEKKATKSTLLETISFILKYWKNEF